LQAGSTLASTVDGRSRIRANAGGLPRHDPGQTVVTPTGNLLVARFRTSPEPRVRPAITHALRAGQYDARRADDGQWRALSNEALYRQKRCSIRGNPTVPESLRARVQRTPGYEVRLTHLDGAL
jgi:hypothetical protein